MNKERYAFDQLMILLDQVVTRMNSAHAPANDYGTGIPLYRVEIHTIQAIGLNPGINVSALARNMSVTKGAISQTVNKLARKGLVRKMHVGADSREISLLLTDLGWVAYHQHEAYHEHMYRRVRAYFGNRFRSKLKTYATVMKELNDIISSLENESDEIRL